MTTALLLLAVLVLILLNALFVAAEFALVRSRKAHLESDAEEGKRGAALAARMMDDLSRYLSAVQVGITLTSLGIGFIGEPAIGTLFEDAIGTSVSHNVSYAISFAVIANYWRAQREAFDDIERHDAVLTWMTFAFLMAIAFLPFPTLLLGAFPTQQISVADGTRETMRMGTVWRALATIRRVA